MDTTDPTPETPEPPVAPAPRLTLAERIAHALAHYLHPRRSGETHAVAMDAMRNSADDRREPAG